MTALTQEVEERFWPKVDRRGPDECWEWQAGTDQHGYGKIGSGRSREKKTMLRAHRVAWELTYGPIPAGEGYHGTCVLHRCDNPSCVNPAHLFLGTQADNHADMDRKGRRRTGHRYGQEHHNAKLTPESVREIRRLWAEGGITQRDLARRFGVTQCPVAMVLRGKTWRHVE